MFRHSDVASKHRQWQKSQAQVEQKPLPDTEIVQLRTDVPASSAPAPDIIATSALAASALAALDPKSGPSENPQRYFMSKSGSILSPKRVIFHSIS
jgi:hypothetical protein